ncbi:MAG: RluA family pseudouridine synthase [Patescibacteria group bacterium]
MKISILYEDADIVAINKPAGLMVHADGRAKGPFLTDWVMEHFPQALNVGELARALDGTSLNRSGIVHRLDMETSGVLLVAKTAQGFECLKKQFQGRTIKKKYLAFVWGEMKEEFGTINRPIGRSSSDFRKKSAQRGARGELRVAETYWTKIASASISMTEKFSLIEAEPKTGRTHQIRVHFAAIQHPVVGDKLYAPKRPTALGFNRTALHSRSIEFDNCEGKRIEIEAPLPEDFKEAMNVCGIKKYRI